MKWMSKRAVNSTILIKVLTPIVPSAFISLARLTRPYAPRPSSPSITNSDILRPPRKDSFSFDGVGAAVEAELRKLDWLP